MTMRPYMQNIESLVLVDNLEGALGHGKGNRDCCLRRKQSYTEKEQLRS